MSEDLEQEPVQAREPDLARMLTVELAWVHTQVRRIARWLARRPGLLVLILLLGPFAIIPLIAWGAFLLFLKIFEMTLEGVVRTLEWAWRRAKGEEAHIGE